MKGEVKQKLSLSRGPVRHRLGACYREVIATPASC